MSRIVPRLVGWSVTRPRWALLLALLLTVLAGAFAAARFDMITDTAELISPDVEWRRQERAAEAAFPQLRDTMLVVIDGVTPELAEDAAARLATALGGEPRSFRRVTRPDGGDFLARHGLLYGSRAEVAQTTEALVQAQPLLGPLAADPSLRGVAEAVTTVADGAARGEGDIARFAPALRALTQTTDAALAGRPAWFSWQRLLADGRDAGALAAPTRRLLLVQPVLDHAALEPGAAATERLHAVARTLGLDAAHGVRLRLTGEAPLADEEFTTLRENIGLVGMAMLVAMLVTLWLATRSAKLVAAIAITTVAGLVVTAALGLLAVGRFNLISVAFIPLFVGLGVDFGIQLCVRFNAERAEGAALDAAMARAGSVLGPSLLLAAGAVILGFAAFLPTAYVGVAELGVIAAMGMVVALLLSVTLLPALVALLRPAAPPAPRPAPRLAALDRALVRHRRAVLVAFAGSLALSVALLPWVAFDFNPLHLRDPDAPAMATLADLRHDPDRTPETIQVLAPDASTAASLATRLAALPEVRQVVRLDSFVPDDQPAKLALIEDASLVLDLTLNPFEIAPSPTDAELVASLRTAATALQATGNGDARALAEAFTRLAAAPAAMRVRTGAAIVRPLTVMLDQVRASLQAGPVSRATLPPEMIRDWLVPDGRERLQLFPAGDPQDNATAIRFRNAVIAVTPAVSGLPVATQAAAATVAGAFVRAGVIAFALVSLLLLAMLRDVREVLFTLAPVVLSIFLTLGTCVLIGQPINFANIIAFPLLFGVGVAFHIYFVMAWRAGTRDLIQSSLARAVFFSAMATGTAFGSLWLSQHPGTASMGKVLMISLVWTLICALIFEPALLGPPREDRPAGPGPLAH